MKRFIYLLFALTTVSCQRNEFSPLDSEVATNKAMKLQATGAQANPSGNDWMQYLANDRSLSSITIPGTHDAGARFEPVYGTAKTQNLTIAEQLNAGVRFLDIRCRFFENSFTIHHGAIYQNMNFDDVLVACRTFLEANPSETIVMSVKEEHTPSGNTMTYEERFLKYTQDYAGLFRLGNTIPTLGEARGKIVLLRRFGTTQPIGINAANGWQDDTSFTINNPESTLKVQDAYQVGNNNTKWNAISGLLNESKNSAANANVLYLNFSSGYQKTLWVIPNIPAVSNDINPRLMNYFGQQPSGRFGIIITDFIHSDLSNRIFKTNF